jgi:RNA polymerase sigma factor (sigma-70 family)
MAENPFIMIGLEISMHLEKLRIGDPRSQNWFHKKYYRRLRHLAIRYFIEQRINDPDAAHDIATEVIRKFFEYIKTGLEFDTSDHLNFYLYVSVRNSCYSYPKSKRYKWQKIVQLADPKDMKEPQMDDDMIEVEIWDDVYKEVEKLNDAEKRVLKLYLEGLKYKEIAGILKNSVLTVRNQKLSAEAKLRIAMRKKALLYLILTGFCPN